MPKQLEVDLTGTCQLWQDLDREELKELKKNGLDITARFLRVEKVDEYSVNYVYYCNCCEQEESVLVPIEKDFLYIADCPSDESPYDKFDSYKVVKAFLLQLNNTYVVPRGATLRAKSEPGGGGYVTLICEFSTAYPYAVAFAYALEGNVPEKWSPAALKFLNS